MKDYQIFIGLEIPWLVSIQAPFPNPIKPNAVIYQHICAGAFIADGFILTAAQCFETQQVSSEELS